MSDTCADNNPALQIKRKARELGFLDCGICQAGELKEDAERLKHWLDQGFHGTMQWMENHFEKRIDPRMLVEGARSLIIVLQNYQTSARQADPAAPRISKYAYGRDYHQLVKQKLRLLLRWIQEEFPGTKGRAFVDSAPVMERAWARKAGLGWIGRHSLLLNRKYGSWFFIGSLVTSLELEPDRPVNEYCGDCTRCIDACPTQAILPGRMIDSRRCISYLTIENRGADLPPAFKGKMENHAFGCDICQEVCPWNHNAHEHNEPWLKPRKGLLEMKRQDWMEIDEARFNQLFEGSAVKRTKFSGLRRNLDFLKDA